MTLQQLEKRVTQEMLSQQQLQAELANASSELTNLQTLPERAQISMSQAYNAARTSVTSWAAANTSSAPASGNCSLPSCIC